MIVIRTICLAFVALLLATATAAPVTPPPGAHPAPPPGHHNEGHHELGQASGVAAPIVGKKIRYTPTQEAEETQAAHRVARIINTETADLWGKHPSSAVGQQKAKEHNDLVYGPNGHIANESNPKTSYTSLQASIDAARASSAAARVSNLAAWKHNLEFEKAHMTAAPVSPPPGAHPAPPPGHHNEGHRAHTGPKKPRKKRPMVDQARAGQTTAEEVNRQTADLWGKYPFVKDKYPFDNPLGQEMAKKYYDLADGHKNNIEKPTTDYKSDTASLKAAQSSTQAALKSNADAIKHNLEIEKALITAAMNAGSSSGH